jgi:hypothetical protein
MIETIAESETPITEGAVQFLTQLREDASEESAVRLSPKQYQWLRSLFERAEKNLGRRPPVQSDSPPPQSDNVVSFAEAGRR